MNSGQSSRESSSCGQENGAALSDPERPLKKARFPWQIKGKHHLKNQTNEANESSAVTPIVTEPITPPPESDTLMSNKISYASRSASLNEVSTNASKDRKRLKCQGSVRPLVYPERPPPLPLRTVITLAESVLMRSRASRHDFEAGSSSSKNSINAAREAWRLRREEDRCISRWQAAQVNNT